MAELVVMYRDGEQMNVPAAKVAAFLAEGWKEIGRYTTDDSPVAVAVETPSEQPQPAPAAPEPKAEKPKKGKAKS